MCALEPEIRVRVHEGFRQPVLHISGCIEFEGNPVPEFRASTAGLPGAALTFRHEIDTRSAIAFYVFPDKGATAFIDAGWNNLVEAALEGLPEGVSTKIIKPFVEEANSGPPVLGHVSLECRLKITDASRESALFTRLCLVPVPDADKILLVGLWCDEAHFRYMDRRFEPFVRSLCLPFRED